MRSALGKAIPAASPPALRREMLDMTASPVEEDAGLAKDRRFIEYALLQTKKNRYASSVGGSEAGISTIALLIPGGGPVLGSLKVIFFSSSMTPEVAARKYLPSMRIAVREIERRWSVANKREERPLNRLPLNVRSA